MRNSLTHRSRYTFSYCAHIAKRGSKKGAQLTENQLTMIKHLKEIGMFALFQKIIMHVKEKDGIPKNMDKFFVLFLKTCMKQRHVLPIVSSGVKHEFDGRIIFWAAQGVSVVTVNDHMKFFYASRAIKDSQHSHFNNLVRIGKGTYGFGHNHPFAQAMQ